MNALPPPAAPPRLQPAWKLWANPILRRYIRARLRPQALSVGLIVTGILAGFVFFAFRTVAMYQGDLTTAGAERTPLIPLMILQSLILFFLGTGQVAAGMTGEADEGVIDYQRLTPMSPLAKVLGYLFGLPVREYVMFLAIVPFVAWGLWRGEVPAHAWVPIYTVIFTATLGYHLTGLVAGTVLKNRRWAFLLSIAVVFMLYTVMPQVAKFGMTTFRYLTIRPVFDEKYVYLLPQEIARPLQSIERLAPEARFFNLKFPEVAFSVFAQGGLILTFVVMLWRRWRRAEAHLLGKAWAVGLFAWIHLMLLGNALPLIEPGLLFPLSEVGKLVPILRSRGSLGPHLIEAELLIGLYGFITLMLLFVLTGMVTPTPDRQIRGLRRARKLGWPRIPVLSDAATSFWFVLVMALIGTVAWTIFARELFGSRWFATEMALWSTVPTLGLVLVGAGLAYQALLESRGARSVFMAMVFVGVVPVMIGAVLVAASTAGQSFITPAMWLMGLSPLSAPFYATQTLIPSSDFPISASRAIPPAFWFWQCLTALVMTWLVTHLVRQKRARAAVAKGVSK